MSDTNNENDEEEGEEARTTHVDPEHCVWCKCEHQNATQLSTGEHICQPCLHDLREWKRTRFIDLLISPSLEPTLQATLLDGWAEIQEIIVNVHDEDPKLKALPSRTSNAHDWRFTEDGQNGHTDD